MTRKNKTNIGNQNSIVPTQPSSTLTASSNPVEQNNLFMQNDDSLAPKPQTPLEIAIQDEKNADLNLKKLERETKLIKYCIAKKNKQPMDKQLLSIENSFTEEEKKFVNDHLKFSLKTLENKEREIIAEKGKAQRDLNSAIEKTKQKRENQGSGIMNNAIKKINDPNYDVENNRTLTKITENKWSWTSDSGSIYHAIKHSGKFYYLNPENEFEIINTKENNKLIGYYDPRNDRVITREDENGKFCWAEPKTNIIYGIIIIYDGINKPPYGIHKLTPRLYYTILKENRTYIGTLDKDGKFLSNHGIDIKNNRIFWVDNEKNQSFWTHPKTRKVYRLIILYKSKNISDCTFGYIANNNGINELVEVNQDGDEKIIASNLNISRYGENSNIEYRKDPNNNRIIGQSTGGSLSYTEPNTKITYKVVFHQNQFLYLNENDCIVDFKEDGEVILTKKEFDTKNNRILHLGEDKILRFTDPNTKKTYTVDHFLTSDENIKFDKFIKSCGTTLYHKYIYYNENKQEVEIDKYGNETIVEKPASPLAGINITCKKFTIEKSGNP